MSESFVGGPVAKTALQAMYAASRKLGREGLLEVVRSLTQKGLPGTFRETTMKYLVEGRTDNAESILARLKGSQKRSFGSWDEGSPSTQQRSTRFARSPT